MARRNRCLIEADAEGERRNVQKGRRLSDRPAVLAWGVAGDVYFGVLMHWAWGCLIVLLFFGNRHTWHGVLTLPLCSGGE